MFGFNGHWRCDAAMAFLEPVRERPNLTVLTGVHVTRVVIEGGVATGVEWVAGGQPSHLTAFSIYGASLVLLYTASTLYHSLPVAAEHVARLRALDQAAIYFLIAGTYTPFALGPLHGRLGSVLLGVIWGLAIFGVILKTTRGSFRGGAPND